MRVVESLALVVMILVSILKCSQSLLTKSPLYRSCLRMSAAASSLSAAEKKKDFILRYGYIADILEKRTPYRGGHIKLLESLQQNGIVIAAGPTSPPKNAFFIFKQTTRDVVEKFIADDPYIKHSLVTDYEINEWNVVVGSLQSKL